MFYFHSNALFLALIFTQLELLLSVPDDENEDIDVDTQAILTSDFEIGHYIRERIIPHAVLYYTGR